ncbi:MAG TPA: alpha-N-arabinofuranosidase [Fimbriimonas sp.]
MSANPISIRIRPSENGSVVNPNVYGHFAEHLGRGIYEGLWVGEDSLIPNTRGLRNDVVAALRELNIPVLRWPGGCFADEYHWKDGIGPRERRPSLINTHWGGVVENNHFGTHEFFDLCEQLGAEPYVCGNVGSGTPQEMMEWVEYITSDAESPMANLRRSNGRQKPWKLRYFGVGNESWGCGGSMRPEYYADEYRRYNTFVKNYSGNQVYRIACGANSGDLHWTEVLMERAGRHMDGLSLHYYTLCDGWPPRGSAIEFTEEEWGKIVRSALDMGRLLNEHIEIMDRFDPEKRVGLIVDEWGTWFECEPGSTPGFLYQQNGIRDAVVAALTLHIFHTRADRVAMANIAQLVNVLQATILTDGERFLRTPTYWVFEMLKGHQGGTTLGLDFDVPTCEVAGISIPALSVSATRNRAGETLASFANLDIANDREIEFEAQGSDPVGRLLASSSMLGHNTFDAPDAVSPRPLELRAEAGRVRFELPRHSVATIRFCA